jgi:hypothetical protein
MKNSVVRIRSSLQMVIFRNAINADHAIAFFYSRIIPM